MKVFATGVLLVMTIGGCGRPDHAAPEKLKVYPSAVVEKVIEQPEFCALETAAGETRDYFARLDGVLASNPGVIPLEFYAETIAITDGDASRSFKREEMRAGARALLSVEDWRGIARRGERDLKNGGWRGCYLGDGKAVFAADARGRLGLSGFDKVRAWGPGRR